MLEIFLAIFPYTGNIQVRCFRLRYVNDITAANFMITEESPSLNETAGLKIENQRFLGSFKAEIWYSSKFFPFKRHWQF